MGSAHNAARLGGPALAQAAGRCALFYAGWLAQAQLGMALSWGWFGGLAGVALWWAVLAWLTERRSAVALNRPVMCTLAGVASGGLALAMAAEPMPWRVLGWLVSTVAWSALCHQLAPAKQGQPASFFDGISKAQTLQPLAAGWTKRKAVLSYLLGRMLSGWTALFTTHLAGLIFAVWLAAQAQDWVMHWPVLCVLLLISPWLKAQAHQDCSQVHRLDAPTGLMMGSLLPMAQWCSAVGWTAAESITLHVLAMWLGLAVAARWTVGPQPTVWMSGQSHRFNARGTGPWGLAAVLCVWWASPWAMLAAAGLVAGASALNGAVTKPGAAVGALLLLGVGQLSVVHGAEALRMVLAPTVLWAMWRAGQPLPWKKLAWRARTS